ncbi:MAG: hypothetical protein IKM93_07285 [Bacteroidales bacterium]|nr:hypothetical protein [Bacteroidales bacterium]
MPLRDNLRKEVVVELTDPVGIVRLLNNSHIVYPSDFDLVFDPTGPWILAANINSRRVHI